jgi:hypothetical protein
MNKQTIGIYLDELLLAGSGGSYLVVNTRANVDSWRFSHETAMRLYTERASVKFLDLSFLDPSTSLNFIIRKLVRNYFKTKSYERTILAQIKAVGIVICPVSIFDKIKYYLDIAGASRALKFKPVISKESEVAIKSWLAVSSGSTHYKWNIKSRTNLFRANRSVNWTNKLLDTYAYDISCDGIFTFNGRFPVDSTLIARAKKTFTQTILFDGGSLANDNRNRIQYFNTSPHNPTETQIKIREYWESANERNREVVAKSYLNAISEGKRNLGSNFEWNPNPIKSNINTTNSVVFFASSDWEQGAIMKWLPSAGFRNQFEVVDALVEICRDLEIDLIIKLHPIRKNFQGNKSVKSEESVWKKYFNLSRVQIISEDMRVHSADLIASSLINVGFRTSVTAQSIYAGRDTAICAQVPWVKKDSNYIYTPDKLSLTTAIERALGGLHSPRDLSPLIQWAYYHAVCGSDMKFSEIRSGRFRILN